MNKLKMCCIFLVSTTIFASGELNNTISKLNDEYKILQKQEHIMYLKKQEEVEKLVVEISELKVIKEKLLNTIKNQNEERKKRFFKDDFDELINLYKQKLVQIDKKITEDNKIIIDFEKYRRESI